jgi:hypothetical protein
VVATATPRRRPTVRVPSEAEEAITLALAPAITAAQAEVLLAEATDAEINLMSTERRQVILAAFSFVTIALPKLSFVHLSVLCG